MAINALFFKQVEWKFVNTRIWHSKHTQSNKIILVLFLFDIVELQLKPCQIFDCATWLRKLRCALYLWKKVTFPEHLSRMKQAFCLQKKVHVKALFGNYTQIISLFPVFLLIFLLTGQHRFSYFLCDKSWLASSVF